MNGKYNLIYDGKPALKNPYIICGLKGWVNGGEVSVAGINYFIKQFSGTRFAEIPTSRYHIYQIQSFRKLDQE
jgi:hypothetical protein